MKELSPREIALERSLRVLRGVLMFQRMAFDRVMASAIKTIDITLGD